MTFEIEIRGALLDQHLPVGTPYGDTGNKITVPPTVDVEVVAAIDAAEAEGARRLLVIVCRSRPALSGGSFVVTNTAWRGRPLSRTARPTSASLPYIVAHVQGSSESLAPVATV